MVYLGTFFVDFYDKCRLKYTSPMDPMGNRNEEHAKRAFCKLQTNHLWHLRKHSTGIYAMQYCWWKKFCTTWDVWNLVNNGRNYLSTGAGFLPATISLNQLIFQPRHPNCPTKEKHLGCWQHLHRHRRQPWRVAGGKTKTTWKPKPQSTSNLICSTPY